MSEYLKREDVRRTVLHNEGDAVIAAIDALPPVEAITIEEFMHMVADEIPEQYARIAGQMVDFKTEDLTDAGRELLCGEKRDGWIPVTERLPELTEQVEGDNYLVDYSKDVLVYVNGDPIFTRNIQVGRYQTGSCGGEGFTDEMFEPIHNVTHWMPLPQPPEVKE